MASSSDKTTPVLGDEDSNEDDVIGANGPHYPKVLQHPAASPCEALEESAVDQKYDAQQMSKP